jgi:hypothetical protein
MVRKDHLQLFFSDLFVDHLVWILFILTGSFWWIMFLEAESTNAVLTSQDIVKPPG